MKRKIQTHLTFLPLVIFAVGVFGEGTNSIYYSEGSDDDYNYQQVSPKERAQYYARLQDAAVKAGECHHAELDPEGHWGDVVMGFQSSIRSKTNVFKMGDPILVGTILRNTTTNTLFIPVVSSGTRLKFVIKNEFNHDVQYDLTKFAPGGSGFGFRTFESKHQIKNEYDLNRQFSLKAGNYKIHTEQRVFEMSSKNTITNITNLTSGVILIKVIQN